MVSISFVKFGSKAYFKRPPVRYFPWCLLMVFTLFIQGLCLAEGIEINTPQVIRGEILDGTYFLGPLELEMVTNQVEFDSDKEFFYRINSNDDWRSIKNDISKSATIKPDQPWFGGRVENGEYNNSWGYMSIWEYTYSRINWINIAKDESSDEYYVFWNKLMCNGRTFFIAALNSYGTGCRSGSKTNYVQIYDKELDPKAEPIQLDAGQANSFIIPIVGGGILYGAHTGFGFEFKHIDHSGINDAVNFNSFYNSLNTSSNGGKIKIYTLGDGGYIIFFNTASIKKNGNWHFGALGYYLLDESFNLKQEPSILAFFYINDWDFRSYTSNPENLNVAKLDGGLFGLTWMEHTCGQPQDRKVCTGMAIMAAILDENGALLKDRFEVSTGGSGWRNFPSIASTQNGGLLVSWSGSEFEQNCGWYNSNTSYNVMGYSYIWRDEMNARPGWYPEVGYKGCDFDIYIKEYDRSFTSISEASIVNSNNKVGLQVYSEVKKTDDGDVAISWYDYEKGKQFFKEFPNGGIKEKKLTQSKKFLPDGTFYYLEYDLSRVTSSGDYIETEFNNAIDSPNIFPHDFQNVTLYNEAQVKIHKKIQASTGIITPNQDLALQFKIVDKNTGEEWISPAKNLIYASPDQGSDIQISYTAGPTNGQQIEVIRQMTNVAIKGNQVYSQTASLSNGTCGTFGDWSTVETPSTITDRVSVSLESPFCYRFKWSITNIAGVTYESIGGEVMSDRAPPALDLTQTLSGQTLNLTVAVLQEQSGLSSLSYSLNYGAPIALELGQNILSLQKGSNLLVVSAQDIAGNQSNQTLYHQIAIEEPSLLFQGVLEGETYGDQLRFSYSLSQSLSGLILYLDNEPITNVSLSIDNQSASGLEKLLSGSHQVRLTGVDSQGKAVDFNFNWTDGEITLDLSQQHAGAHQIVMQGKDEQGNLVKKATPFSLVHGYFSFNLLSPAPQTYKSGKIQIQIASDRTFSRVWYRLNSGPEVEDLQLDLVDGTYHIEIFAQTDNGAQTSQQVDFKVANSTAELILVAPVEGEVITSDQIPVSFSTNGAVTYQLGDQSGSIASGQSLPTPSDGSYALILTSVHPVSGSVTVKSVNLTVDRKELLVNLQSPFSRLYGTKDIPIEYTTNKPVKSFKMTLDGQEVQELTNLSNGSHILTVQVTDSAGRKVVKTVNFQIAGLSLLSPAQDQEILSTSFPQTVPLIFESNGNFTSITSKLDQGQENLLDTSIASQEIKVFPGDHELELKGYMSQENLLARSSFKVGAPDLVTSLNYTYQDCRADTLDCHVDLLVDLFNTGNLDIKESFKIKVERVGSDGRYDIFWLSQDSLQAQKAAAHRLSFRSKEGDLIRVSGDPFHDIKSDSPHNNIFSARFTVAPQVLAVGSLQNSDRFRFLTNISYLDVVKIIAIGGTRASVQVGNVIFYAKKWEGGYRIPIDVGLLTPENPCAVILVTNDRAEKDSSRICYKVFRLGSPGSPINQIEKLVDWTSLANQGYASKLINWVGPSLAMASGGSGSISINTDNLSVASVVKSYAAASSVGAVANIQLGTSAGAQGQPIYHLSSLQQNNGKCTWQFTNPMLGQGPITLPLGCSVVDMALDPSNGVCSPPVLNPILESNTANFIAEIDKIQQEKIDETIQYLETSEEQLTRDRRWAFLQLGVTFLDWFTGPSFKVKARVTREASSVVDQSKNISFNIMNSNCYLNISNTSIFPVVKAEALARSTVNVNIDFGSLYGIAGFNFGDFVLAYGEITVGPKNFNSNGNNKYISAYSLVELYYNSIFDEQGLRTLDSHAYFSYYLGYNGLIGVVHEVTSFDSSVYIKITEDWKEIYGKLENHTRLLSYTNAPPPTFNWVNSRRIIDIWAKEQIECKYIAATALNEKVDGCKGGDYWYREPQTDTVKTQGVYFKPPPYSIDQ